MLRIGATFLALLALTSTVIDVRAQCDAFEVDVCNQRVDRDMLLLLDASDTIDRNRFQTFMLSYAQAVFCSCKSLLFPATRRTNTHAS